MYWNQVFLFNFWQHIIVYCDDTTIILGRSVLYIGLLFFSHIWPWYIQSVIPWATRWMKYAVWVYRRIRNMHIFKDHAWLEKFLVFLVFSFYKSFFFLLLCFRYWRVWEWLLQRGLCPRVYQHSRQLQVYMLWWVHVSPWWPQLSW